MAAASGKSSLGGRLDPLDIDLENARSKNVVERDKEICYGIHKGMRLLKANAADELFINWR